MLASDKLDKINSKKRTKVLSLNFVMAVIFGIILTLVSIAWHTRHLDAGFVSAFTAESAVNTVGLILTVIFLLMLVPAYSFFYEDTKDYEISSHLLVLIVIFITYFGCIVAADYMSVFAMPIGICASLVCILINRKTAMLAIIIEMMLLMLTFIIFDGIVAFTLDYAMIAIFANTAVAAFIVYMVSRSKSRIQFIVMSLFAGLIVLPFTAVVLLARGSASIDILIYLAWHIMSTVLSVVLFMFLLPLFESIFNIADDFRLDEICNLKHPLLRRLAEEASGTFNHSQSVAVLAENCALAIGENHHLARAAAYYHDVGKLKSPLYFVENQDNYNPHDELLPEVSVSLITSHTAFGVELCKKYHIPKAVADIAREHHGDSVVSYFYMKAKRISGEDLPAENFSYGGPKPQSKVAAIIMIVDTVEAASRVNMPDTHEKLEALIDKFVKEKMEWHQLDECPITLRELTLIKKSIVDTLPAIRHGRISYIDIKK